MYFQSKIIYFVRVNLLLNMKYYNRPHSPESVTSAEPQLTRLCVHSGNWTWRVTSAPATWDTSCFVTTSNRWVSRNATASPHTATHRITHLLHSHNEHPSMLFCFIWDISMMPGKYLETIHKPCRLHAIRAGKYKHWKLVIQRIFNT
jgi:hypothetical protein